MASYTQLQNWWRCPRKWSLYVDGWEQVEKSEGLVVGSLVHRAIVYYYQHLRREEAVSEFFEQEFMAEVEEARIASERLKRAAKLTEAFVVERGHFYQPLGLERVLEWNGITAVVDMMATPNGSATPILLVEFKTGRSPDLQTYYHQGQADLYAYLYMMLGNPPPKLIVYEAIGDNGLSQLTCLPNLERGCYLAEHIRDLPQPGVTEKIQALGQPRFLWDCSTCPYFSPCRLMEDGADWLDYLQRNYVKREPREAPGEFIEPNL